MSDDHAEDIGKHVRAYMIVFGSLLVLTVVTVGIYYLELSVPMAITLALFIATIKGSLVACYFMHMISEKRLIYWIMLLTVLFFIPLLLLPVLTSVTNHPGS